MAGAHRIVDHYGQGHPKARIEAELIGQGFDLDRLRPADLAGVDEFHLGGHSATIELLRSVRPRPGGEILDVGSGIGGVARSIAAATGCRVHGVDLTPAFVETATWLSELVGFADRTVFEVGDASALDFDDDRFAAATLVHVGMNIEDKALVFTEIGRTLAPGSSLHVYDLMRISDGDLTYPVPWSTDASTSFLERPSDYVSSLEAAGFEVGEVVDRTGVVRAALAAAAADPPLVNLAHLMGDNWPTMFGNLRSAVAAGVVAPIEIIATVDQAVPCPG